MQLELSLNAKQSMAWDALHIGVERLGYGGARGGGKSHFVQDWQIYRRLKYPKTKGLVVRQTYQELQDNHIDPIQERFGHLCRWREQKKRFEFPNGSILKMGYIRYPKRDLKQYQGGEYTDICIDESQMHEDVVRQMLLGSLRTKKERGIVPTFIETFNPGDIGHADLKKTYIDRHLRKELPGNMAFIQATVDDNPAVNKEYVRHLDSLPEKLRRAWRDGDWTVFEGQYFTEFGHHLREKPYHIEPHKANIYGSLDYGDGEAEDSGATSFGYWHVDQDGKPHRLFTYYRKAQAPSTYAREIFEQCQSFYWTGGVIPKVVFADPSMFVKKKLDDGTSRSIADVFIQHGLPLVKANNDRVNGWRIMRHYFGETDGEPNSYYWGDGYNSEFEEYLPLLMHDDNRPEDVKKCNIDHVGDESRYFYIAAMSMGTAAKVRANRKQNSIAKAARMHAALQKARYGETGLR